MATNYKVSHFADNVTPVYPKNSCKLVGKSLIKFFSLVNYFAKVVAITNSLIKFL